MERLFFCTLLAPLVAGAPPRTATSIHDAYWSAADAGSPRIAVGTPTTLLPAGRLYKLSTEMRYAYHMFLTDYFERHGGVLVNGTRLGLDAYYLDDASDPQQAEWAARELVRRFDLRLFLAGYSVSLTDAVAAVVNATGGTQVASGASGIGTYAGRPAVFGTLPKPESYAESALEFLGLADGGARKGLWFVTQGPYGRAALSPLCARNNIEFLNVSKLPLAAWEPAMQAAAREIVRADPDIVFLSTSQDMCHAFVRHLWELEYSPKAFILLTCPAGPEFIQAVGSAGQYVLHVTPWLPSFSFSGPLTGDWTASSFATRYESLFGVSPSYQVASAFAGVAALVYAIETANSLDPQAVAGVLRGMNVGSIFGNVSFDGDGLSNVRMKVTQYQMTEVPLLLYPCDACEASLLYPRPNRSLMDCLHNEDIATRYGWMQERCVECPLGRRSRVSGNGTRRLRVCAPCSPGRSGRDTRGALFCEDCQPGFFSGAGAARACEPCPVGSYASASGLTACRACAAGRVADAPGTGECAACAAGSYLNATGQSLCRRCEVGRYSAQKGATGCRACPPSLSTQGSGFSSASACGCPAGTLDPSLWDDARRQRCEACAEGLRCPGFGAPPELAPGYYEAAAAFSPLRSVWLCVDAAACPGGAPGSCSGEREGLTCSLCPAGRARGADYRCMSCDGEDLLPSLLCAVGLVLALVPVYYLVNGPVVQATSVKLGTSITVGIAITVVQILGMFNRLNIPWAPQVRRVLEMSAWAALDTDSLPLECLIGQSPVAQYLFTALAPFAVAAIFGLLALASGLLPRLTGGRVEAWTLERALNALLSLGQALFIALTSMAAVSVQCYSHPNGKLSMMKYPSVICFEGDHIAILAMGALMLSFLVIPFVVVCAWGTYSVHHNTQVYGPRVPQLEKYRFLIFRFQPTVWWWGNAFNARQVLLGIAPMVTPDDPSLQLYFVMLVLLVYLIGTVRFFPWRVLEINVLDVLTVSCLILALAVGTGLLPPTAQKARHEAVLAAVIYSVIAFVAVSLAYCLLLLATRGPFKRYGVQFPPESRMDGFVSEWVRLLKKVSQLSPEEQRDVIGEMDAFERLAMDHMMCIMEASFDVKQRHSRARAGLVMEKGGAWRPHTKMLRLCATEARFAGGEGPGRPQGGEDESRVAARLSWGWANQGEPLAVSRLSSGESSPGASAPRGVAAPSSAEGTDDASSPAGQAEAERPRVSAWRRGRGSRGPRIAGATPLTAKRDRV